MEPDYSTDMKGVLSSYSLKLPITWEKSNWTSWMSVIQLALGKRWLPAGDSEQLFVICMSYCLKMGKRPSLPASGVWHSRLLLDHIWTDSYIWVYWESLLRQSSKVSKNSLDKPGAGMHLILQTPRGKSCIFVLLPITHLLDIHQLFIPTSSLC